MDTNLYAIVRHPQYVAGLLFNLSMMLLCQKGRVTLQGPADAFDRAQIAEAYFGH